MHNHEISSFKHIFCKADWSLLKKNGFSQQQIRAPTMLTGFPPTTDLWFQISQSKSRPFSECPTKSIDEYDPNRCISRAFGLVA